MNKKRVNKIVMWLLVASLPVALAIVVGAHFYKKRLPEMMRREAAVQNAGWAKYNYVPIADASVTNQIEQLINAKPNGSQLPANQKMLLIDEVQRFFGAYSQGLYKAYKDFRMPADVPFIWKTDSQLGPIDKTLDRFNLPKVCHFMSVERKFYAYLVAANGNGRVYSNLFTDVCFERSSIVVQECKNPLPVLWKTPFFPTSFKFPEHALMAKSVVTAFPNAAFVSQKKFSYIKFEKDNIEDIANRSGTVTTADCFFFIKRRKPYPILPIIVRLYWNPTANQWLPDDVVICDAAQESERKPGAIPIF